MENIWEGSWLPSEHVHFTDVVEFLGHTGPPSSGDRKLCVGYILAVIL